MSARTDRLAAVPDGLAGWVLVEAVRDRASSDAPLVLLEAAIVVAGETSGAAGDMIEHYVGAARAANVSWTFLVDAN